MDLGDLLVLVMVGVAYDVPKGSVEARLELNTCSLVMNSPSTRVRVLSLSICLLKVALRVLPGLLGFATTRAYPLCVYLAAVSCVYTAMTFILFAVDIDWLQLGCCYPLPVRLLAYSLPLREEHRRRHLIIS